MSNITKEQATERLIEAKKTYIETISEYFDALISQNWEKAVELCTKIVDIIDPELQVYCAEQMVEQEQYENLKKRFNEHTDLMNEIIDNGE